MNRKIEIKVIKENSRTVTIKMMSVNRSMPVQKSDFENRIEESLYEVVN